MTVGIISDTHGLVRDEALAALAGVSSILHAGDVGTSEVLRRLSEVAPVQAVRGNIDCEGEVGALPAALTVIAGEARIHVLHRLADLGFDPAARGIHAVISGHSHKASQSLRDGVLYLNPGSAGPRRFRLPVTLALLLIDRLSLSAEIVRLA